MPQLYKHRGAREAAGRLFRALRIGRCGQSHLNTLARFLLRSCSDSVYDSRTRPCLLYQIKRCSAPCTGEISVTDYAELVEEARDFLSGKSRQVQEALLEKMQAASEATDFEAAAAARDRIRALTYVQQESGINPGI